MTSTTNEVEYEDVLLLDQHANVGARNAVSKHSTHGAEHHGITHGTAFVAR